MGIIADQIPHGMPDESITEDLILQGLEEHLQCQSTALRNGRICSQPRQLLALMTFVKWTRIARRQRWKILGYSLEWVEAVEAYLAILTLIVSPSYNSTICMVDSTGLEAIAHTYTRFALPITWDFAELAPFSKKTGGYLAHIGWVTRFLENILAAKLTSAPCINQQSSRDPVSQAIDGIITDPPYYDAIPYADLSDFFYVWLRRSIGDRYPDTFAEPLTPKSAELVQHSGRFDGDNRAAKAFYEDGMAESFRTAYQSLSEDSLMVTVFAHKNPDAWETLTTAMISVGLVVTASWPIDTERQGGLKGNRAALATSLWLVCRKRPANARVGHYGKVRREMQERITERLRYFWDAGIQGPDFVWAAIGPALESYSSYKEVRRNTGEPFTVTEFLTEVRRIVTDFALGTDSARRKHGSVGRMDALLLDAHEPLRHGRCAGG